MQKINLMQIKTDHIYAAVWLSIPSWLHAINRLRGRYSRQFHELVQNHGVGKIT